MNLVPDRTTAFIATALLPVATVILGVYCRTLSNVWIWQVVLGICIIAALAAYLSYRNIIKPVRDLRSVTDTFLKLIAKGIMDQATSDGITADLDVLTIRHPWNKLLQSWFVLGWNYNSSDRAPGALQFHVSKGVCGQVYRQKRDAFINIEGTEVDFGFTEEDMQRLQIGDVAAVYAWPIFRLDHDGHAGKVIGVLSFYAKGAGSGATIAGKLRIYKELLSSLRDILSRVMSK